MTTSPSWIFSNGIIPPSAVKLSCTALTAPHEAAVVTTEKSADASKSVIRFIENLNVKVLGAIGLGLLIYTVISLVEKVEESVNFIWHIAQLRSFAATTNLSLLRTLYHAQVDSVQAALAMLRRAVLAMGVQVRA